MSTMLKLLAMTVVVPWRVGFDVDYVALAALGI